MKQVGNLAHQYPPFEHLRRWKGDLLFEYIYTRPVFIWDDF